MVDCYYIEVIIANKDEWLQYVTELVENRGTKSDEELLEEACKFDFKFETKTKEITKVEEIK